MNEPVRYENSLGQVRWQPLLDTGERLWQELLGRLEWSTTRPHTAFHAVVYRFRFNAVRAASKKQKDIDSRFKEITDD